MSQHYFTNQHFRSESESETIVRSERCAYTVWISEGEVSLSGPGVDETSELDNFPDIDSTEDLALIAVLLFENGAWPED